MTTDRPESSAANKQENFIKNTNSLFNTSLYTRVLKLSKNQYYFENKEN